jgi:hypothetical protein
MNAFLRTFRFPLGEEEMITKRFQVEIGEEQMDELKRLMELAGISTNRDLFNNALTLFKWAARVKQQGLAICSVDSESKTIRELEMPVLDTISARSARTQLVSP